VKERFEKIIAQLFMINKVASRVVEECGYEVLGRKIQESGYSAWKFVIELPITINEEKKERICSFGKKLEKALEEELGYEEILISTLGYGKKYTEVEIYSNELTELLNGPVAVALMKKSRNGPLEDVANSKHFNQIKSMLNNQDFFDYLTQANQQFRKEFGKSAEIHALKFIWGKSSATFNLIFKGKISKKENTVIAEKWIEMLKTPEFNNVNVFGSFKEIEYYQDVFFSKTRGIRCELAEKFTSLVDFGIVFVELNSNNE